MRSIHPIGLELLSGLRIRIGRVNPFELKLNPSVTLFVRDQDLI